MGSSSQLYQPEFFASSSNESKNIFSQDVLSSVTTDKPDYSPSETAYISAVGFEPGETVVFQVLHIDGKPNTGNGHLPWEVIDGSNDDLDGLADGNIETSWYVDPDDSFNSVFELTAEGLSSGITASHNFKDDTPVPTDVEVTYNAGVLTLVVDWGWTDETKKTPAIAVFADTDCDGDQPDFTDDPTDWVNNGGSYDEFLGQTDLGTIVGSTSADCTTFSDQTINGLAFSATSDNSVPHVLIPYGLTPINNSSSCDTDGTALAQGTFTITFTGLTKAPKSLCVVVYDVHMDNNGDIKDASGNHSIISAGDNRNTDNSVEEGNDDFGIISCADLCQPDDVTCEIQDIDEIGCSLPSAEIEIGNVFGNVFLCGGGLMDVIETNLDDDCTDGDGFSVSRTYRLFFDENSSGDFDAGDVLIKSCDQSIAVTPLSLVLECPNDLTVECEENIPTCTSADAEASNYCGSVIISCTQGSLIGGACGGSVTNTYTATDGCGNSISCNQTITVDDTEAPMIICPVDVEHECDETPDYGEATATDNCSDVTITFNDLGGTNGCVTSILRTWIATDACGNSIACAQTILIHDTTAPVITCPDDVEHECDVDVDYGQATAIDNCSDVAIAYDDVETGDACETIIERTWTATDACDNSSSCVQTITIADTTAPVITLPDDISVDISCEEYVCGIEAGFAFINGLLTPDQEAAFIQCNEDLFYSLDVIPTGVTDNCDNDVEFTPINLVPVIHDGCVDYQGSSNVKFSLICWFAATDECGNEADQVFTVLNIVDFTDPIIICPEDVTYECDAIGDFGVATATDDCGNATVIHTDLETGDECETIITRTWTATDECGNTSSCVQTITIVDTTPPMIICPVDVEHECDETPDYGEATATDNCSDVTITFNDLGGTNGCVTSILRTWIATDACGNSIACAQTILIHDTTAPVITCPDDVEHECDVDVDYGQATAIDNCSDVAIAYDDVETGDACETIIERTWTATDACDNSSSCVQTITIADTTAPVITLPDDISVDISCEEYVCGIEAGFAFINGLLTPDQEAAFIQCNEDLFYSLDVIPTGVTDNCDNDVEFTPINLVPVIHDGCVDYQGSSNVKFSLICWFAATDECGNEADQVFTVLNIVDFTDPIIICPEDVTYECDAIGDFGVATATDDCGNATVIHTDLETGDECETIITRTWTATDECGNTSSCVQTITIVDTTPPMIICPVDVEHECDETPDYGEATATDNCSDVTITFNDLGGTDGCVTSILRTWIATDACGNSIACAQTILIHDTTPPVITCPDDVEHECDVDVDYGEATATDNCNSVTISSSDVVTSDECETIIERIWVAIDDCGNASRCMQTITIVDTTPPVITCPEDVEYECHLQVLLAPATATDNCNEVTITSEDVITGDDCETVITRTWTATDACGNSSRCVQTITIVDTTAPVITCPADVDTTCDNLSAGFGQATATDNCNDVTITFEDATTGNGCENGIERTWTATDACGNVSRCIQTIIVSDTTPPVITCPDPTFPTLN